MSDNSGIFGEILEQGSTALKQAVKQVAKTPSDLAKTAGKQVKGPDETQKSEQALADEKAKTKEFVKDLYKPSVKTKSKDNVQKPEETEEQKLAKLRQELHSTYYQRLVQRPKKPEEQERPQERVERQEKEDRWKLEEKKKKETPIAVQRSAQKAEKYPGASG